MNSILCRRIVVHTSSRLSKLLTNPTTHSKPNQSRYFRTYYLPWTPSSLWRAEKVGGSFTSALVDSRVGFQRRGWTNWFQGLSANGVVLGLVIANTAVFFMWCFFDVQFMMKNFLISLENITSGRVHTLITSEFSHVDIVHLISNMIGLYFFGSSIARNFGPLFLLKLYFAGALGGSVFHLIDHSYLAVTSPKGQGPFARDPSRTPALGASGDVNAIMLLDIFLHPNATIYLEFIIPVPAMLLGVFLIGKDILGITEGNSNIASSAHLGGAAVAAIAWARIRRGRFHF